MRVPLAWTVCWLALAGMGSVAAAEEKPLGPSVPATATDAGPSAKPATPPVPAAPDPAPAATALPAAPSAKAAPPKPKPEPPPAVPVKLSDDPRPTFGPETFVQTMNAAERYRTLAERGGWPVVPNEATRLVAGQRGATAAILRARLAAEGDLAEPDRAGDVYDVALASALRRFQMRHGLEETGLVGPRTLAQLNVPAAARLRQLQASAARLLGSRFPFGERYVAVNIPSASVEAVERGVVQRRYVAVVGKPDRPSPTLETRVTSVNFNPTWTVPVSLIRKDIIPHVRKDPGYLAKMKIRLFDATGQEVDPARIDWSTERAVNYTVRQDAGLENSLGEVRIDMPNRHSVYMHDTPSKRLFARNQRAQSSGCVRVSGVKGLASWLLEGTPGPGGPSASWGEMEIETTIAAGKRVDVRLSRPVPVAWVYLTGFAGQDGTAHFRDDIYRLDEPAPLPPESRAGHGASAGARPPLAPDPVATSSIAPVR